MRVLILFYAVLVGAMAVLAACADGGNEPIPVPTAVTTPGGPTFGRVDMVADGGAADANLQTSLGPVAVGNTFTIEWEVGDFATGDGLSDTTMVVNYPAFVSPTAATMTLNAGWYRSPLGAAFCAVNSTAYEGADMMAAGCNLPGGTTDSLATGRNWLFQITFRCDQGGTGILDTTNDSDLALLAGGSGQSTWGDGTITCQ